MMNMQQVSTKQRLGRQTSVSIACQQKTSFVKKAAQSIGTAVVTVGLVAGTSFAYDNPNVKLSVKLTEYSPKTRDYQFVQGEKQDKFLEIQKQQLDATYGRFERSPEVQKILQAGKDNAEFLDQLRKAKTYAAYARAQQGQDGFMECSFPSNFFGCDGKFAKNDWMKKAREMSKEVDSKMGIKTNSAVAFGQYTKSLPK